MSRRVVVTGMGAITPVGVDMASTWRALVAGESGIDYISLFDPEGLETRVAAEVKGFDPTNHMTRKEARRTDRFTQFAAAAAHEAVASAGLDLDNGKGDRVACLIGSGIGGIETICNQYDVLRERGANRVSPFLVPMILVNMASGQVSMYEGARGPNLAPVSACSSGSDAIGQGMELISHGDADAAIVGGTEAPICALAVAGFNAAGALSRQNHDPRATSRPFDRDRDGFVMGEGAAVLVLESADHAVARGAPLLAEVAGWGATGDAYHITQPAPGGSGAARAMDIALRKAGLAPGDIDYINAHGTGTPTNDKFETAAIKRVFGPRAHEVRLSSTKSMTGHLLGAAGALEAAACVLAIRDGIMPPTINLDNPDPECDLDYTPRSARHCPVRTAMSNALGFGGHNSTLVFRAWQG